MDGGQMGRILGALSPRPRPVGSGDRAPRAQGRPMIVLLVALGAAIGAPLRYLVDRAVQARHDTLFP